MEDYNSEIERKRWIQIFQESKSLHLLFWTLLFAFLVITNRSESGLHIKLIKTSITIFFYMVIVYTNWFVLIPSFLKKQKLIIYILSLIVISCLITPPKIFMFFKLFEQFPSIQQYFLSHWNILLFESLFVSAASSAVIITQDWLFQERDKRELQSQQLQSELNFLKSQINPHFLFNTLNNLYALTLKKSDQAPEMVLRLSEMMRYMLYECNESKVPLDKEINYLKNYLELEKIRQKEDFIINLNITGESNGHMISPLIFVPFVENSFKHGMNQQIKDGFININLDVQEESIYLHIENSIAEAIQNSNQKKSGGIGLINIKRRLELLYPQKHTLRTDINGKKYSVNLKINF